MTTVRSYPLAALRGLTAAEVSRLDRVGIDSTKELLQAAATRHAERSLAKRAGLSYTRMREAVNRADLVRVNGLGPVGADLFENAGVNSVRELAQRNATSLHAVLEKYVKAHPELNYRLPSPTTVKTLVERAKQIAAPQPPANDAVGPERAAADLKAYLPTWYQSFWSDVPPEANSLGEAQAAVKPELMTEIVNAEEDPHGHDLTKFRVFAHPDVVFPGSDNVWYVAYDRQSGQLQSVYDFN